MASRKQGNRWLDHSVYDWTPGWLQSRRFQHASNKHMQKGIATYQQGTLLRVVGCWEGFFWNNSNHWLRLLRTVRTKAKLCFIGGCMRSLPQNAWMGAWLVGVKSNICLDDMLLQNSCGSDACRFMPTRDPHLLLFFLVSFSTGVKCVARPRRSEREWNREIKSREFWSLGALEPPSESMKAWNNSVMSSAHHLPRIGHLWLSPRSNWMTASYINFGFPSNWNHWTHYWTQLSCLRQPKVINFVKSRFVGT